MRSASGFFNGPLGRREFGRLSAGVLLQPFVHTRPSKPEAPCPVSLSAGRDRAHGIRKTLELLGDLGLRAHDIWIKASFDSGFPYPATTHLDALSAVVTTLREAGAGRLRLVEQSWMGDTRSVLRDLGVLERAGRLGLEVVILDDLPGTEWRSEKLEGSHWKRGVEIPRFLAEGARLLQLCNLRTHRFGALYAASLENSLGLIARYSRGAPTYSFVAELQQSPDQRQMIAEVNSLFKPVAVVMDAMEVFMDGGPERGDVASPGVIAASRDRVAIDAVGVALLRVHGAGGRLGKGPVFDVEEIKRAVELKLGCTEGDRVTFLTADTASAATGNQLLGLLRETGEEPEKK